MLGIYNNQKRQTDISKPLAVAILFLAILTVSFVVLMAQEPADRTNQRVVLPKIVTQPTRYDTDDPAIWINPDDPAQSLVLGTDKDEDGALYVFDLSGNILESKVVRGLRRPNNVDVERLESQDGTVLHIAVTTERLTNRLRVYALPDMTPIDRGGIEVFVREKDRSPMGIDLYRRANDGAVFAFVSRKSGPTEGYIWQYRLKAHPDGSVSGDKVRAFGTFSGGKEIEAIASDDELGFVYFADEGVGIRKYHANPEMGDEELALFGTTGFAGDREGISIFDAGHGEGYILVSDQQAGKFQVFNRSGPDHQHRLLGMIDVAAVESDGSELVSTALPPLFPNGLFVAMSDDRTFHFYDWQDMANGMQAVARE